MSRAEPRSARPENGPSGQVVAATGLTCGFGETALLRGADLCLEIGQAVAVVGENGAGKTTLLRTLTGALKPIAGSIQVLGKDLLDLDERERARMVAYLPQQDSAGEGLSVRELVELGRTPYLGPWGRMGPEDRRSVEQAIEVCQLTALADQRIDRLSGGERQRARIAMTVAQQATLLLLDEPVNHLDLRRRHDFFTLLKELRGVRGIAVVMVLHDLAEAYREADDVMVIHGGRMEPVPADDPDRTEKLARAFGVPAAKIEEHILPAADTDR